MSQNSLNWRTTGANIRVKDRQLKVETSFIVTPGDPDGIQCTVRDFSNSGARLRVENGYALPLHFRLKTNGGSNGYRCEIVWRKADEVGVRFVD